VRAHETFAPSSLQESELCIAENSALEINRQALQFSAKSMTSMLDRIVSFQRQT
jgi:hypothetical protein